MSGLRSSYPSMNSSPLILSRSFGSLLKGNYSYNKNLTLFYWIYCRCEELQLKNFRALFAQSSRLTADRLSRAAPAVRADRRAAGRRARARLLHDSHLLPGGRRLQRRRRRRLRPCGRVDERELCLWTASASGRAVAHCRRGASRRRLRCWSLVRWHRLYGTPLVRRRFARHNERVVRSAAHRVANASGPEAQHPRAGGTLTSTLHLYSTIRAQRKIRFYQLVVFYNTVYHFKSFQVDRYSSTRTHNEIRVLYISMSAGGWLQICTPLPGERVAVALCARCWRHALEHVARGSRGSGRTAGERLPTLSEGANCATRGPPRAWRCSLSASGLLALHKIPFIELFS